MKHITLSILTLLTMLSNSCNKERMSSNDKNDNLQESMNSDKSSISNVSNLAVDRSDTTGTNNRSLLESKRSSSDAASGEVSAPDNSAQNEKTQNKNVMIPTDQGDSEKDQQITKDIRSSIVGTDMSFNAKNIKIITKDERVFLKGVVETSSEHQAVLKIARNHAKSAMITDEIKVNSK